MSFMRRPNPGVVASDCSPSWSVQPNQSARDRGQSGSMLSTPVSIVPVAPAWHADAKCANDPETDVNFFYPEPGQGQTIRRYCAPCPVRSECLDDNRGDPHGWFGGVPPSERALPSAHRRSVRGIKIGELADAGWSHRQIADVVGLDWRTVQRLRARAERVG